MAEEPKVTEATTAQATAGDPAAAPEGAEATEAEAPKRPDRKRVV